MVDCLLTRMDVVLDGKADDNFKDLVDETIMKFKNDKTFSEGIKYIDEKARETGEDFYDLILRMSRKTAAERRAAEWLRDKSK